MANPVDELFALPPEEFTAQRDALAKELAAAGDKAAAKGVKALRRPTVAAWALNQVARRHSHEVEDLIAAGEALVAAQEGTLRGDSASSLRTAARERRERLEALRDLAGAVLRDAGTAPEPHVDEIAGALEAASVDTEVAAQLRAGHFSRAPAAPAGFGFGGFAAETSPGDATRERAAKPARAGASPKSATAKRAGAAAEPSPEEAALAAAEEELAERRTKQQQAAEAADAARETAEAAAKLVTELEQQVDELRRRLSEARTDAAKAERAAEKGAKTLAAADAAVGAADRALAKTKRG